MLLISFLIVLIIAIVTLYMTNEKCREIFDKYIFGKEVSSENLPEIEIDSLKNSNIFAYSKYIAVLNQNILKLYNKSANLEQTLDIEISTPLFAANGNYLCISQKGRKYYIFNIK